MFWICHYQISISHCQFVSGCQLMVNLPIKLIATLVSLCDTGFNLLFHPPLQVINPGFASLAIRDVKCLNYLPSQQHT